MMEYFKLGTIFPFIKRCGDYEPFNTHMTQIPYRAGCRIQRIRLCYFRVGAECVASPIKFTLFGEVVASLARADNTEYNSFHWLETMIHDEGCMMYLFLEVSTC